MGASALLRMTVVSLDKLRPCAVSALGEETCVIQYHGGEKNKNKRKHIPEENTEKL